jgi:7,8-dihydropterin-6-yl-methyl-4-(beta-D-ribofuranosyl)aminobenzene 5'-phosphate synthase
MRHGPWLAPWLLFLGLGAPLAMATEPVRITVAYNNVPHAPGLATAWGFAAVIESGTDVVLFDSGGDGPTLLANLARLGIEPGRVTAVVLSHSHGDHTGGLDDFLARRPKVAVYMPASFPVAFRRAVERRGARVETVRGPQYLFGNLYTTGELGDDTKEQALIVDTESGLIVITGCAHPDIVRIAESARDYRGKGIRLLMGGFHLLGRSPAQNRVTVAALHELGVRQVAPSHCTGDEAIALFRRTWGSDFLEGGCGAIIEVP